MEKLALISQELLEQLAQIITALPPEDFQKPSPALSQASIGQHVRHILEFFICLQDGHSRRVVNYDHRKRDHRIETEPSFALEVIDQVKEFIARADMNQGLRLDASYSLDGDDTIEIPSNLKREIAYNVEHAVHHMALIKIGLREIAPTIEVPKHFGIAISTVRHRVEQTIEQ